MATLVTGIGFVGAYVVRDLVASGRDVVIYGRFGPQDGRGVTHPNLANLRFVMGDEAYAQVTVVVGDIVDAEAVDRTIAEHGIDEVVHLAAMVAAASEQNLAGAVDVNVVGTINLFESAVRHQVKRIVQSSSINVFGPRSINADGVIDDSSPLDPGSAYGATKAFIERYALRYWENVALNSVSLRLGKVYGFGEHVKAGRGGGNTWFRNLIENPAMGIGPVVVPFGDRSIDFVYVEDVSRWFVESLNTAAGAGDSFVTVGDYRPIKDAFAFVRSVLPNAEMTLVDGGEAAGLTSGAQTNWAIPFRGQRVNEILGIAPKYSMEQGILRTISEYRRMAALPAVTVPNQ